MIPRAQFMRQFFIVKDLLVCNYIVPFCIQLVLYIREGTIIESHDDILIGTSTIYCEIYIFAERRNERCRDVCVSFLLSSHPCTFPFLAYIMVQLNLVVLLLD